MVCQTVSSKTRLFLETVSMKTWGQTPWDIDFDLTGYQQPRLPEVDLIDSGVVNNHLLCPLCNEVYEVLGSHLFSANILCMCNAIHWSRSSRFSSGSTFYSAFITFVSSYVKKSPKSWRIFQSDQPTGQPNISVQWLLVVRDWSVLPCLLFLHALPIHTSHQNFWSCIRLCDKMRLTTSRSKG